MKEERRLKHQQLLKEHAKNKKPKPIKKWQEVTTEQKIKQVSKEARVKYEGLEKSGVGQFIREVAGRLKAEGVPVKENGRIDMDAFANIYSQGDARIDVDKVKSRNVESVEKFASEFNVRGEKLEMLKTALFNKFLGDKFIVIRSSSYDDAENGVDNLVLEKSTGNLICMFDEAVRSGKFQGKLAKIKKINSRGGAKIKYGFRWEDNRAVLSKIKNVPIFALILSYDRLEKSFDQFVPSFEEKTDYEKYIFSMMINSLKPQIELLKQSQNLHPELKKRLDAFEDSYARVLDKIIDELAS